MKITNYTLDDGTPWRLYKPDSSAHKNWAVLWLQGFTSTIDGHHEGCERMSKTLDVSFAILNYAGHGNHPIPLEKATRKQQFEEVCAVYDELSRKGFENIIVIGGSFGGYLTALLSAVRSPKAVVLRAPANYKDEEFDYPYSNTTESKDGESKDLYRKSISSDYTNMATEALRSYNGIGYIIEHGADTVINKSILLSYYNAMNSGSYITIQGLGHSASLMPNPDDWYGVIENWIQAIIKSIIVTSSALETNKL